MFLWGRRLIFAYRLAPRQHHVCGMAAIQIPVNTAFLRTERRWIVPLAARGEVGKSPARPDGDHDGPNLSWQRFVLDFFSQTTDWPCRLTTVTGTLCSIVASPG